MRVEAYAMQNRECASIIAATPSRYPGLMQDWAKAILNDLEFERPAWRLCA
jgi:hypothetical protein